MTDERDTIIAIAAAIGYSGLATSERRRAVRVLRNLPRVIEEIDVPEAQRICPCCGEALSAFGHESSEQLQYIPARLEVHEAAPEAFLRPLPRVSGPRTPGVFAADPQEHGLGESAGVFDRQ